MRKHNIPPSNERKRQWKLLHDLKMSSMWSCHFLKQEVATDMGIMTYYVLVFLHIGSQEISLSVLTDAPTHSWVNQQIKTQVHNKDCMKDERLLIRDNDILFPDKRYYKNLPVGETVDGIVESGTDIKVLHTAYQAPKMNAFCERAIRTIGEGAGLDKKWTIAREDDLRNRLIEFHKYNNTKRHLQGLENSSAPRPISNFHNNSAKLESEKALSNLNYYHREAA